MEMQFRIHASARRAAFAFAALALFGLAAFREPPPSRDGFREAVSGFRAPSRITQMAAPGLYAADGADLRVVLECAPTERWVRFQDGDRIQVHEKIGPRGDMLYLDGDSRVVLRFTAAGGATVFTEAHPYGLPLIYHGPAAEG